MARLYLRSRPPSKPGIGFIKFECLEPGTYKLYAWKRLDGAAYKNAEFMKTYQGRGVALVVQTGRNLAVEVRSMDR